MLSTEFPTDELLKHISKTVNELMKENKDNFKKHQEVMAPLSAQIAVIATLEVLNKLGFIRINEPTVENKQ